MIERSKNFCGKLSQFDAMNTLHADVTGTVSSIIHCITFHRHGNQPVKKGCVETQIWKANAINWLIST